MTSQMVSFASACRTVDKKTNTLSSWLFTHQIKNNLTFRMAIKSSLLIEIMWSTYFCKQTVNNDTSFFVCFLAVFVEDKVVL